MNRNSKLTLLAVLTSMLMACSNESSQDGGKQVKQSTEAVSEAVATVSKKANEMADETIENVVTPAIEDAKTSMEETIGSVKSAVTEMKPEIAPVSVDSDATSTENASSEPTEHIIKGVITQWYPLVTFAQPGDTIRFTGMTGHDTASMQGMIPDGATAWHSKLGEEGFSVTVNKEGGYVYKCTPHITTGMVGIIVVGDKNPTNLAQLEANVGNVKVGGNMVKRAIRKLKQQLVP